MNGYRPEVDGLRALAVLPVLLFHAGFPAFKGGFIGVDVFFVISGYLITRIIHKEMIEERFSLVAFYARRARRILPAVTVVVLFSLIVSFALLNPNQMTEFLKSVLAVNLFSSNILFWLEADYFAQSSELKPLLHTWSLAVEEQFYFFFPLLLLFLVRFKHTSVAIAVSVITAASFILAEVASRSHPNASFFLLPTRAWELGAGVLVAITYKYTQGISDSLRSGLAASGLVLVVASIFVLDKTFRMPGIWTMLPVLGSVLIIAFGHGTATGRLLSVKPFVAIGLISYSLYLWHQPLFAFARISSIDDLSQWHYILLIVASVILAIVSYYIVEQPFRKKTTPINKVYASYGALSFLFVIVAIVGVINKSAYNWRFSHEEIRILSFLDYDPTVAYSVGKCFITDQNTTHTSLHQSCATGSTEMIWGDSHAAALAHGLRELVAPGLMQITIASCAPLLGDFKPTNRPHCARTNLFALDVIKREKPKTLFLHANWYQLVYWNKLGYSQEWLAKTISETIKNIAKASPSTSIVIVGGVPQWPKALPSIMYSTQAELSSSSMIDVAEIENLRRIDQIIKTGGEVHGARFFSVIDSFCSQSKCKATASRNGDTEPFTWDRGHLTLSSSIDVATALNLEIKPE